MAPTTPAAATDRDAMRAILFAQAARAKAASRLLSRVPATGRDAGLRRIADAIRSDRDRIAAANARDLARFDGGDAFRDRLTLTDARIDAMADGLDAVASLPDPLHRVLGEWRRPNGLRIRKVAVPIGVIGMIYESRPNVGADAAAITLKSGNAVILRGGSDGFETAGAIGRAVAAGLAAAALPPDAVQTAPVADRAFVAAMLDGAGLLDLLIPRGGRSLIERVNAEARVPVLGHAEGICHTYVHRGAEPAMAVAIVANAKMRRPGICGATETLLIDASVAPTLLPPIATRLASLGCALRGDARAVAAAPAIAAAAPDDFGREFLDAILAVAVVDGVDDAIAHVNRFGSAHTDAIVTADADAADRFLAGIDGAVGMWNASTQFCDGGEFGFGAEIGIATGRLHARGPVGPAELTTFRYHVIGDGQVRS